VVDDAGKFTFDRGDRVVAFAEAHHMPVLGHMLLWHYVTRKWLFEDAAGKPLPRDKALANLKKYIDIVARHYQGRIKAWNVANEAISDTEGEYLRDTPALKAIGADYLEQAFTLAHAAAPQAELYYNDYNIERSPKLEKTIRLVRSLQAKGLRIDAVGIQGHWLIGWPSTEMINKGIDALAATGVKVMITELDIDPLPRNNSGVGMVAAKKGDNPYPHGLPADMQQKLAKRYGDVVRAIAGHAAVTMITFWGTHDGRSWLNGFPVKGRTNHPLLFDRQLQPKPAFDAVIEALKTAHE
jgi:endo-1,4-beta-xylanase